MNGKQNGQDAKKFRGGRRQAWKMSKQERIGKILQFIEIPLTILYLQLVFQLSTVGRLSFSFIFYGLMFGISYGLLLEFLVGFIPNRKVYKVVKAIVIVVLQLLMCVVYFVFAQFGFYDINTMLGGAGGALGEFRDQVLHLIFNFSGIGHIILFFLPLVIYIVFARVLEKYYSDVNLKGRIITIVATIVLYLVALLFARVIPVSWSAYSTEYNYAAAVTNFGIFTGLRLDVKHIGSQDVSFDMSKTSAGLADQSKEDDTNGENKLDIDFNALADKTDNETLKNLDMYVASLEPSKKNAYTGLFKDKNLIFITAEAFTKQVIDPNLTPTLYRMANKGFRFTDYYQTSNSGTTGGEYSNIFGMLPTASGKSFKRAADNYNYMTMSYQLNKLGYWGKAYHNNTYTFYDRHITHNKLGFSQGYVGRGNGMEKCLTPVWPESDLEMMQGTVDEYIKQDHFNIYYMSVSGHSPYGWDTNAMARKHRDEVANLNYSQYVKGYIASNIELDRALEYLIKRLEAEGKADDTVIVIAADHFPYGLDEGSGSKNLPYLSELYGKPITDSMVRDENRLIIWSGCLEDKKPVEISSPVDSLDILPTLMNLFGIKYDSRLLVGRDVFAENQPALVFNGGYDWKTDYGKYISTQGRFTPVNSQQEYPLGMSETEYVNYIKSLVKNKIKYCYGVLDNDYYKHVFGK